jgi:cell division septation protein DedD
LEPPPTAGPANPSGQGELPTEHIALTPQSTPKPQPKPAVVASKTAAKASAPTAASRTSAARKESQAGYTVQVAASREKGDAEKLMKELRSRGFDVFVVPPKYSEAKDNLYRVQVGPYGTREEPCESATGCKEGFKPFIKN